QPARLAPVRRRLPSRPWVVGVRPSRRSGQRPRWVCLPAGPAPRPLSPPQRGAGGWPRPARRLEPLVVSYLRAGRRPPVCAPDADALLDCKSWTLTARGRAGEADPRNWYRPARRDGVPEGFPGVLRRSAALRPRRRL